MSLKINPKYLFSKLIENYYWIIIAGYTLAIFVPRVSIVAVSSILLVAILALQLLFVRSIKLDLGFVLVLYFLLSGLLYIKNGLPFQLYLTGVSYVLLPTVFYLIPRESIDVEKVFSRSFLALLFSFVLAVLFYYWWPEQYRLYCISHGYISAVARPQSSLQGIYGVTLVGSFAACAVIYYYGKWIQSNKLYHLLATAFSFGMVLFAGRRSAIFACILLFLLENLVIIIKSPRKKKHHLILIIIGILGVAGYVFYKSDEFSTFFERLTGISTAINERLWNWLENIESVKDKILLGKGLGAGGHIASSYGYLGVHDNSYLMMLVENGVIGLLLFLALLVSNFIAFLKNRQKSYLNYIALYIVIIFAIQAIGSNVFEFPTLAVLFWFSLSCCGGNTGKQPSVVQ